MPPAPKDGTSLAGLPARAVCGTAAAGLFAVAQGARPASAGVPRGPLMLLVPLSTPAPRPPGHDGVGACGVAAAGFVGLAVGYPVLATRGRAGSACGVAAADGVVAVGHSQWRAGLLRGGTHDGCVGRASREVRAAAWAGRTGHAVVR